MFHELPNHIFFCYLVREVFAVIELLGKGNEVSKFERAINALSLLVLICTVVHAVLQESIRDG